MANPPFNVDLVDGERVKNDPRLPFGLPGVNKNKKVSNGNYLWISYFWSYLSAQGRAGFVMSSQASSAGHGEKDVRRKIIETGDVDVMISIRPNFFYTRTVPCELWFFDRAKPKARRNQVLMLDARRVFRKVTRTICEFSPEQLANLAAIVWLYRGQRERFLGLVKQYFGSLCSQCGAISEALVAFEGTLKCLRERFDTGGKALEKLDQLDVQEKQAMTEASTELRDAVKPYEADRKCLLDAVKSFCDGFCKKLPATNEKQHAGRRAFDPIAERIRGLVKQVDLVYKLAARVADLVSEPAADEAVAAVYDRRAASKLVKQLDGQRKAAVEQLKHAAYFHRQVAWLQDRFPDAELKPVAGLVKLVDRNEIEAAGWSLTPGRYVGVAPEEPDDDFDFEQTIRDIHIELADLNREAVDLAAKIQESFEELGA
jgi:type I restriction enzyme M protein